MRSIHDTPTARQMAREKAETADREKAARARIRKTWHPTTSEKLKRERQKSRTLRSIFRQ